MKLHRTAQGVVVESNGRFHSLIEDWNTLINHADLLGHLRAATAGAGSAELGGASLAPVVSQEVWAAGVTYLRSRSARIDESQDAGGGTFYDRVYHAARPEIFFKASAFRVKAPGETIRVRGDSKWSVPEPELALYINARGQIIGYTVGNDVSSRDIEGENPLYLPQAKVYDGSCALGPAVLVTDEPLPSDTAIELRITRNGSVGLRGQHHAVAVAAHTRGTRGIPLSRDELSRRLRAVDGHRCHSPRPLHAAIGRRRRDPHPTHRQAAKYSGVNQVGASPQPDFAERNSASMTDMLPRASSRLTGTLPTPRIASENRSA